LKLTAFSSGLLALLFAGGSAASAQTLTTAQARAHDDENATVCGVVVNQHTAADAKGKPTFIDLDSSFPNTAFSILVWDDDRAKVGALPHKGNRVCVTGLIAYYHGVPQMTVHDSKQFSVPK
jgi:hypothetical protein